MIKFLKRLLSGDDTAPAAKAAKEESATHYDGFDISPRPRKSGGGWSTEAVIRKRIDGEIKEHAFIRADASPSKEEAIALIVRKAKTLIDQKGERIFK
ncbi:MAG: HlyU family transcriptional regulator [bacterium]